MISQALKERFQIKGRSGKQCRERWHNHLCPRVNKEMWSLEEEKVLFKYHSEYGNKWSCIAKHLPGRSDNSIKNHFYSTIRRNLRLLNKTRPEGSKVTGDLTEILKDAEVASCLLKPCEGPRKNTRKKDGNTYLEKRRSIRLQTKDEELSDNSKEKPAPIVCPSPTKYNTQKEDSVIGDLFTPSAFLSPLQSNALKTPGSFRVFKFPDELTVNPKNHSPEAMISPMSFRRSDSFGMEGLGLPSPASAFTFPSFSPKGNFNYFSPKNK